MVSIWKAKKVEKKIPSRIQKLSDSELTMWADSTIMSVGMAFDSWRHHGQPIEQVQESMDTLNLIMEEIYSREVDKP